MLGIRNSALAILGLLIFLGSQVVAFASDTPVLRLVYKESGKPPYMERAPDSTGLYTDLVAEAVRRIGYRLEVVRVPKARAYLLLQRGEAELYPSLLINAKRGKFLAFVRNGLHRNEEYLALTPASVAPLRSVQDITLHGLSWIYDRGSSAEQDAAAAKVPHYAVSNLDLARAIDMARAGRPVFYKVVDVDLSDYLEANKIKSLAHLPVRLHETLFQSVSAPLYLGFSKVSTLYQEEANPAFNADKPVSFANYPTRLVADSVPDKLGKALNAMVLDGTVEALLKKYKL